MVHLGVIFTATFPSSHHVLCHSALSLSARVCDSAQYVDILLLVVYALDWSGLITLSRATEFVGVRVLDMYGSPSNLYNSASARPYSIQMFGIPYNQSVRQPLDSAHLT